MAKRLALGLLALASLLALLFSFVGGPVAAVGLVLVAGAFPFALMTLGAARGGRLGRAAVPIGLLLALVEGSLAGMLLLRGRGLEGPWIGGLPGGAALLVYGLVLAPLLVTSIGFAVAFRDFDVDRDALARLQGTGEGGGE